jgi:nucleoside-diphosphate-sugar epimerase
MHQPDGSLSVTSLDQLEHLLSEPTPEVVDTMRRLDGDILLLGAGGKIGPSLARMARRASDLAGVSRRVIAVSRFSSSGEAAALNRAGVEIIRCDLLDESAVADLPDAPNVIHLAGLKFGSNMRMAGTWAMNTYLPAVVCRKYRRSRIVAYSTGAVYGLSRIADGGSVESDPPAPVGEYAMTCLGRERMFEHFSTEWKIPVVLIRLFYACELRYGVLVDLARKVFHEQPIDVTMGHFNVIWQGDNNAMTLRAFEHTQTPPTVFNVTGPELLSIRETAEAMGRSMGRTPKFIGQEVETACIGNAQRAHALFGPPRVKPAQLMEWVMRWVEMGGEHWDKPTHFEVRDGKY